MKDGIHPTYHDATVTCACGNTFRVGSTTSKITTEVCSACHPFYTGQTKMMDTAGRVERFTKIIEKTKEKKSALIVRSSGTRKPKVKKRSANAKKLG